MADYLLEIQDLHAYYGTSHVLQGLSLQVGNECVALLGRNGMGKTTLMRAILRLRPPECSGIIRYLGEKIANKESYEIGSLGIGYVPQGRRLFPSLSVEEHLQLTFRPSKGGKEWTPEVIYELFPELLKRRKISGARLSGGEQQMLAIGRALVTNPRLLIMDEPSEGLAPVVLQHVILTCRHLIEAGISLLLVEQKLNVTEKVADRVYVMVTGRIVHEAGAKEFCTDEESRRQYLGI